MREDLEPSIVIDNSLVMVWAFDDEDDPYALAVLDALDDSVAIVPALWLWEVTNALTTAIRKGRITSDEAQVFLKKLSVMSIEIAPPSSLDDMAAVLDTAVSSSLTAYDAQYLLLAQSMDLPLATLDREILEAMRLAGVSRFEP